jgi:hypothetical protein
MRDDLRGFLISMDLLFAIIPLTIVLGMVAADMGNILYEMEDTIYQSSNDRLAQDTLNTLAETSGNPPTWEQNGSTPNIVGLAQYNTNTNKSISDSLDPNKLALLTTTDMANLIGNSTDGFNLTVTRLTDSNILQSIGTTLPVGNTDIVRVNKVVLCSNLKSVTSLVGQIIYDGQPVVFSVNSFQTDSFTNQTYNYWILFVNTGSSTNSNATVTVNGNTLILNNTTMFHPSNAINSSFLLTNSYFSSNNVTLKITTNSIGSTMDFYIVQAPKSFTSSSINYNNVVPQECNLTMYLWT